MEALAVGMDGHLVGEEADDLLEQLAVLLSLCVLRHDLLPREEVERLLRRWLEGLSDDARLLCLSNPWDRDAAPASGGQTATGT